MKRISLIAAIVLSFFAVSCNKDGKDQVEVYSYYSIVTANVSDATVDSFVTDEGRVLIPVKPVSFGLKDQQRAVIYFTVDGSLEAEELKINLLKVDTDMIVGESCRLAQISDAADFGNEGTSFNLYPRNPQMSSKYFNFYVGFNCDNYNLHNFKLVYAPDYQPSGGKFLDLVLCHDANSDGYAREWWTWLSLPVDEFKELFEGKETVRIHIKTRMNGVQTVDFRVPEAETKGGVYLYQN